MPLRRRVDRTPAAAKMSAEEHLLLLLARGRLTDAQQAAARSLLGQGLAWPELLQRAQIYGLAPLLHHHLQQLGLSEVPATAAAALKAAYRQNALRSTLMARELAEVMRRLGSAGVPVMPLKGVLLADSLYGDPALRVCGDIDILVPRPLVGQASHLLHAMGYRDMTAGSEAAQRLHVETGIESAFTRAAGGFRYLLELHWGIFPNAPSERDAVAALWADARPSSVLGVAAVQPSVEWNLLFLAVHAARHRWRGLKWLGDIHELCTWTAIDWAKVKSQAEWLGWDRLLELTLSACHTLFGTVIPAPFSRRPLPAWVQLFPADTLPAEPWQDMLATARLFHAPGARWRYLIRLFLVPTLADHRLFRLPPALDKLYVPLRPMRLAVKYGWRYGVTRFGRLKGACRRP
jgi:hypothetical protein